MSWQTDQLRNSRLNDLIGQVERGEAPDIDKFMALETLDLARGGELHLAEAIDEHERENGFLVELFGAGADAGSSPGVEAGDVGPIPEE